ncbi:hypothetical protein G6N74_02605 [Mesorhizobium sp. CGMCC 1.15528]|uniref:TfuA-like core domain-containing protein n=1 Tax=Mesorhizobium zhangyense TaxID=1776730 RepID=A0A7C9V6M4_9HYPH|nr:TfuA-like protein [Mesorhizobium zhangyense]NGN39946.1 hypothetical protein [Mesorhizobium zhangyense]
MACDIVVFLGPTLPIAQARKHLDALYLPPAEQGSVFKAVVDHRPDVVAIIDGVFAQRPAVRHKEILWAMAAGVEVHGASSMGALRAAELAPNGMFGHGFVYRWYRRTPLADDEEVAVPMAPLELGSVPLGDALINMRLTFKKALRHGVISRISCDALETAARSLYFVDRRYAQVIATARLAGLSLSSELDAFERWLPGNLVDRKQADAVRLLRYLADRGKQIRPKEDTAFTLTEAWAIDLEASSYWDDYVKYGQPSDGIN